MVTMLKTNSQDSPNEICIPAPISSPEEMARTEAAMQRGIYLDAWVWRILFKILPACGALIGLLIAPEGARIAFAMIGVVIPLMLALSIGLLGALMFGIRR